MIQRQSDSFSRFAHSSTLLSTFFFSLSLCLRFSLRSPPSPDVAAVSAASSARQRAEEVGWRRKKRRASGGGGTTRKATILSRDAHSTHECARLQKRIPGERARRVKAVVRKEA